MTDTVTLDRDLLARQVLRDASHSCRALVLYGSMVEGLGNRASDIDVLVITEHDRAMQILRHGDRYVHVEYHPEQELRGAIARIETDLGTRQLDLNLLACRLGSGSAVILHDPEGAAAKVLELAQAFRPSPALIEKFLRQSFGLYHDAVGAYQAGEFAHALLLTRLSLQVFTASRLLGAGQTLLSLKWQHVVARSALGDDQDFWETYCAVLDLPGSAAERDAAGHAMSAMRSMLRDAAGGSSDAFAS